MSLGNFQLHANLVASRSQSNLFAYDLGILLFLYWKINSLFLFSFFFIHKNCSITLMLGMILLFRSRIFLNSSSFGVKSNTPFSAVPPITTKSDLKCNQSQINFFFIAQTNYFWCLQGQNVSGLMVSRITILNPWCSYLKQKMMKKFSIKLEKINEIMKCIL